MSEKNVSNAMAITSLPEEVTTKLSEGEENVQFNDQEKGNVADISLQKAREDEFVAQLLGELGTNERGKRLIRDHSHHLRRFVQ